MPGIDETTMCDGTGDANGDHCCYVAGAACTHLVVDGPTGRRYACGLFTELGDWSLVHSDPRYLAEPKPRWDEIGVVDCGDWYGPNNETAVGIRARGEITEAEFVALAQCCYKRFTDTPQRTRQAVRAINRAL